MNRNTEQIKMKIFWPTFFTRSKKDRKLSHISNDKSQAKLNTFQNHISSKSSETLSFELLLWTFAGFNFNLTTLPSDLQSSFCAPRCAFYFQDGGLWPCVRVCALCLVPAIMPRKISNSLKIRIHMACKS